MINERTKTICIISQYCPPDNTADSIRLKKMVKALKNKNFNIIIIAAFPHYPNGVISPRYRRKLFFREKWNGIDIIRTYIFPLPHKGFLRRFLLYFSFTLSSLSVKFYLKNVDLIWAISQTFFSYLTGIFYKIILRVPLFVDVVDIWPEGFINAKMLTEGKLFTNLLKLSFKIIYKISDEIITLNKAMKKTIINTTNTNPSKISILPNITYPNKFKPEERIRKSNNFNIMYSGNFGFNYDFKVLLDAGRILKKKKDIQFIIKGTGDKGIKEFIKKYIQTFNLYNVHIEEKFLNTIQFIKFLNQADIFILPMKNCPYPDAYFPSKLMDYLSYGKPVIYSGEGYAATLVKKLNLGAALNASEPEILAKTIINLKRNEELRNRMGINARNAALTLFSPEVLDDRITKIFLKK